MKQRKSLDLTSKLSLEALISDTGTELSFKFGKKDFRVTSEEIRQLRDWLTNEVLKDGTTLSMINVPSIDVPQKLELPMPSASSIQPMTRGPIIIDPKTGKALEAQPLEDRRATVTQNTTSKDLSNTKSLITPKDQFAAHNLSMGISSGEAARAFSADHVFDGGPGNK